MEEAIWKDYEQLQEFIGNWFQKSSAAITIQDMAKAAKAKLDVIQLVNSRKWHKNELEDLIADLKMSRILVRQQPSMKQIIGYLNELFEKTKLQALFD